MSRFSSVSIDTTVNGSATKILSLSIPSNYVNISKIKIIPSNLSYHYIFSIYSSPNCLANELVYSTDETSGLIVDPIRDNGTNKSEISYSFVAAYEDKQETSQLYIKIENKESSSLGLSGYIIVDELAGSAGGASTYDFSRPEKLHALAFSENLKITFGITAEINTSTVDSAEFRAKYIAPGSTLMPYYDLRTESEGGTFEDNGSTQIIITGLEATSSGCQYIMESEYAGRWYYVWRLHNSSGWSVWSDGNETPSRVFQFIDTTSENVDSGPPSDWYIYLRNGPIPNTVEVVAGRPQTNGNVILWYAVQIKDADTGSWVTLLDGSDADHMKWDGREVSLTLNEGRFALTDESSSGFGTAAAGDLLLVDVRGGEWDEAYCQWAVIKSIIDNKIYIDGFLRPQVLSDLRAIIIKPPWAWSENGYLGGEAASGFWTSSVYFIGDRETREFISAPIPIPDTVTNPEARVWFENPYSRSDDNLNHTTGSAGLPVAMQWTRFNDHRWWIPIYGPDKWATLSFDSNGYLNINAVTPRPSDSSNYGHYYGIIGHFDVYPTPDGKCKFSWTFDNLNLPAYTGADLDETSGIFLGFRHLYSNYPHLGLMCGLANYRTNSKPRLFVAYHYLMGPSLSYFSYFYYTEIDRPSSGSTIDFELELSENSTYHTTAPTLFRARVNGGSWTSVDLSGIEPQDFSTNCPMINPLVPVIGFEETYHTAGKSLSDYDCRLTSFSVNDGIIRQHRIVKAR